MDNLTDRERQLLAAQQGYEQLGEVLARMIAPLVATYYHAMREEGLPRNVAAMLTEDVQADLLTRLLDGQGEA